MKPHEAQSKLLGIRLTAEQLETWAKETVAIMELEEILLYQAFCLLGKWIPETTEDKVAVSDFLAKCRNYGLVKDEEPSNNEQTKI